MTITELCEPLFRYICSINRAARRRADVSMVHVRSEVDRILDEIRNRASEDPQLYSQYELVAEADDPLLGGLVAGFQTVRFDPIIVNGVAGVSFSF